uniref:U15-lycotoxin-Ls1f n=2 Tax=Lycosa singoriensis TaxID=434756 RepID=TXF15_LYCSI|nr:RecName: Full=U15-lycotoxin-Ls1f; AltName: Full=Toxin-like structure LSTX-N15; Flags: Precursor [Lycosa singoriensis]ACI41464.1 toxin-like structure LSTX-N15 precursor [Lycosa singoriensis]CAS03733.1 toxin-like structure LSTX-N15 precursor [Lycosa singoriensis]
MNSKIFAVLLLLGLLSCVLSDQYCPKSSITACKKMNIRNDCCKDDDCTGGSWCCATPCGNFCKYPTDRPGGKRAAGGKSCKTGYVYY